MKKLIFALAFLLVGTFAFANSNVEVEKTSIEIGTPIIQQSPETPDLLSVVKEKEWCAEIYVDTETGEVVLVVMYPC